MNLGKIIAVLPGEYSVAIWSPALDDFGNSVMGGAALEHLTTMTGRSVFQGVSATFTAMSQKQARSV